MNEVVVGSSARVLAAPEEQVLENQVSVIQQCAGSLIVKSDEACTEAARVLKDIKAVEKRVNEYWEPMRKSTYEAYKSVNDHKKAMLDPLQKASKEIQRRIDEYVSEKERKLREQEKLMRRLAASEVDKKLGEAAEAEANGDDVAAEYAMAEAEMADGMSNFGGRAVSVEGATIGAKTWEIEKLIPDMVPISVMGVIVFVKDKAAVEKIVKQVIKESNGKVQIPGVTFREKHTISVCK